MGALLSDVIPIAIFILLYTWYALRRFAAATVLVSGAGVVIVLAIAAAVPPLTGRDSVAGPTLRRWLRWWQSEYFCTFQGAMSPAARASWPLQYFFVSLTLRTVDLPLCGQFPMGTHFAWHLLNAVVLFIVARAMVLYGKRI